MMKHVLSVIFFLIVQIVFLSAPQAQDLNDLRIHHDLKVTLYPHEYDFIYRFSSKLLHATPASITTDQKNLEMSELAVFLKYIYVKIDDVLELVHTMQCEKLGGISPFLRKYLWECIEVGYPQAPLEQEAVRIASVVCRV